MANNKYHVRYRPKEVVHMVRGDDDLGDAWSCWIGPIVALGPLVAAKSVLCAIEFDQSYQFYTAQVYDEEREYKYDLFIDGLKGCRRASNLARKLESVVRLLCEQGVTFDKRSDRLGNEREGWWLGASFLAPYDDALLALELLEG